VAIFPILLVRVHSPFFSFLSLSFPAPPPLDDHPRLRAVPRPGSCGVTRSLSHVVVSPSFLFFIPLSVPSRTHRRGPLPIHTCTLTMTTIKWITMNSVCDNARRVFSASLTRVLNFCNSGKPFNYSVQNITVRMDVRLRLSQNLSNNIRVHVSNGDVRTREEFIYNEIMPQHSSINRDTYSLCGHSKHHICLRKRYLSTKIN
jgi:hypothetical protein